MAGTPPAGRRPSGAGRDRLPHHISNIAHLFFDESADGSAPGSGASVELAVAGLGSGQASAFVCAGLVAGTGQQRERPWRWELCEAGDVTWSAAAYTPVPRAEPEPGYPRTATPGPAPASDPAGPLVRWSHLGDLDAPGLEALERWCGTRAPAGRERRSVRPGGHGLVVTLAEHDAAEWATALRLGRLLGAVGPSRLEVLVFPATWVPGTAAVRGAGADLESWCRALTSSLSGACPLTVTTGLPAPGAGHEAGPVLARIAGRLLGDFEVDRPS